MTAIAPWVATTMTTEQCLLVCTCVCAPVTSLSCSAQPQDAERWCVFLSSPSDESSLQHPGVWQHRCSTSTLIKIWFNKELSKDSTWNLHKTTFKTKMKLTGVQILKGTLVAYFTQCIFIKLPSWYFLYLALVQSPMFCRNLTLLVTLWSTVMGAPCMSIMSYL